MPKLRLWPPTLSLRLFVTILGGVFLAILLSNAFYQRERQRMAAENREQRAIEHFREVIPLLTKLSSEQRVEHLNRMDPERWRYELGSVIVFPDGKPDPEVQERLRQYLSETIQIDGAWVRIPEDCTGPNHCLIKVSTLLLFPDGQRMLLSYTPYNFGRNLARTSFLFRHRDLFVLSITALLAWLVVRTSIRPLKEMTKAAENLGQDILAEPLIERGPPEVSLAIRAFNTMQKQIQGFLKERTQILAAVTHDLKTPLTRMRLRIEHCEDSELKRRLESDLSEMQNLINEGLELARSMHSHETYQLIDLNAMLHSICDDCLDSGIEAHYQTNADELEMLIEVQPLALRRILENLIDNACKYGQRADISASLLGDVFEIHIRDQGPGIPDSLLDSVFQPFVRLEESRSRATGGTGLGLSIAANLIKMQRGSIELENHSEGGLVAIIKIPSVQHPQN